MPSLSERAKEYVSFEAIRGDGPGTFIDLKWELVYHMAQAIEKLTESNHASATIEALTQRIEELETQLTALAPPKSVGAVVKTAWKQLSESDIPAESE